jgi:hypothetical protein
MSSTEVFDGVTVQLRAGRLRLGLDPRVGREQRVSVLLNELNPAPNSKSRDYTFSGPPANGVPDGDDDVATIEFPFRRVVAGTYLIRVRVNGAESILTLGGGGTFDQPQVALT